MVLGIDLNVPFEVVPESRRLFDADAPIVEDALEHLRDNALATVQKRRRHTVTWRMQCGV
ncbi:hypothetical protein D3C78_1599460 [compost metagenome]